MAKAVKHRPPRQAGAKSKKAVAKPTAASSKALQDAKAAMLAKEAAIDAFKPQPLPNVWRIWTRAWKVLRQNTRLFVGIVLIYGVLNMIFVTGIGTGVDVASIRNGFANRALGSFVAYTQLISAPASATNQGAGVYELVLFVGVSLALVWALRQVFAGYRIRVRDAYYRGMYPLVPCLLIVLVFGLQLLPMLVGTGVYQYSVANGIAVTSIENIVLAIVAISLSLWSFWLVMPTLFALYIAALPDMEPGRALRMGKELVKGRRWIIMRKVLFLPLMLLIIAAVLLMPVIAIVPLLSAFWLSLFGPILVTIGHSYLYVLYRELMNE